VVLEALRARRRELIRVRVATAGKRSERGPDLRGVIDAARAADVAVEEVSPDELRVADDRNAQGVVLEAGPLPEVDLDELLAGAAGTRCLVLLDGVEDPQNLGAIARVAEAAGAAGIVQARRRSAPSSPAATRASAGALEWLPVARVANLAQTVRSLKEKGFWLVGADASAPRSVFDVPDRILSGDLVVALGAEGRGLRRGILELVDHLVRIPMRGRVASLNVSTAGAVLLFEIVRRAATDPAGDG
jgi:23S rRNA (guanosine2251-2'-O)-methyltransferase